LEYHPENRIKSAMDEAKVKIDDLKKAEDQVSDVVIKLRPIIPISIETMTLEVHIPAQHSSKLYGKVAKLGKVTKEQWNNDGSLSFHIEIPAGLREKIYSDLAQESQGTVEIQQKK